MGSALFSRERVPTEGWSASEFDESQIPQDREQKEQHGHQVFSLRDPGHRFHVHRMQGEDHGRQKGTGHGQLPQDDPNQQCLDNVQDQISDVVPAWMHSP